MDDAAGVKYFVGIDEFLWKGEDINFLFFWYFKVVSISVWNFVGWDCTTEEASIKIGTADWEGAGSILEYREIWNPGTNHTSSLTS